jgi:hypothetical protein
MGCEVLPVLKAKPYLPLTYDIIMLASFECAERLCRRSGLFEGGVDQRMPHFFCTEGDITMTEAASFSVNHSWGAISGSISPYVIVLRTAFGYDFARPATVSLGNFSCCGHQ